MTIDKRLKFDESYINEECKTTTFYFIGNKSLLEELLPNKYPNADSMEISIEFPTNKAEAAYAAAMISPTRYYKVNESYTDYEWNDIDLPYEELEELITLGVAADVTSKKI